MRVHFRTAADPSNPAKGTRQSRTGYYVIGLLMGLSIAFDIARAKVDDIAADLDLAQAELEHERAAGAIERSEAATDATA